MKVLFENWRQYLNEDTVDADDMRCRVIYTPIFVYITDIMTRDVEAAAKEVFAQVEGDIPNAKEQYLRFERDDQKMEYLQGILIEYLADVMIQNYSKSDMTIDKFIKKTEAELKKFGERAPWFEQFKDCLISGPDKHTPTYYMPQGGKTKTMEPVASAADTFAMFERKIKK
jgi:hypothetical protein